jgi:hypothetical protein
VFEKFTKVHQLCATIRLSNFWSMPMKTTLNKIREHQPCKDGWTKLLKYLGKVQADDVELDLLTIFESNGLDDALWCLRAVDGFEKEKRLMAVAFAREVQHLMTDQRSLVALDVAEKFANGEAKQEDLTAARAATAYSAAAYDAARAAARAAYSAARAASAAASAAAYAAYASATYARAADDCAATRNNQVEIFKKFCA